MNFSEFIQQHVLVLDGATGTMIQDLELGEEYFGGADYKMLSDLLNFSQPEEMKKIHKAFYAAGANAVETNSFGASPMRLAEYDFSDLDLRCFAPVPYGVDLRQLNHEEFSYYASRRAAEIACEAREEYRQTPAYDGRPLFVFGSIGPSNRVLSYTQADLKESTFDAISDNFYKQVCGLLDGGVDVLLFETQQDILEVKAAILGGKAAMRDKGKVLPIIAQVTVDQFSRMQIFNTDIHAALVSVQGMGIDAFGLNCSIGPDLMEKTVEKLSRFSHIPISAIPNAGLPESENGKTVFKFPPEKFGEYQRKFVEEYGVNIVGGCCGTRPAHIQCVAEAVRGLKPHPRTPEPGLYVSGLQEAVRLDGSETLIRFGERLNVRGSKKVRNAVENDTGIDHDALEEVAVEQIRDLGCEIIDVCMDSNQIDTVKTLEEVIHVQSAHISGAMCLDSFQVDALAAAIKAYPGRPIINSVSMEEASPGVLKLDAVMEATQAFSPLYVGLCTGPEGPAAMAADKLALATEIIERAREKYGVTPDRMFIDVNVFPIGSEPEEGLNFALESLEGIRLVREKYPETHMTLGVGNLTNGLAKKPYMRKVLTSVFLDEARKRGLDASIINPNHYVFVSDLDPKDYALGLRTVMERDMDAYAELEEIAEQKRGVTVVRRTSYDDLPLETAIMEKIKDGFKAREKGTFEYKGYTYTYEDKIALQVAEAMDTHAPLDFINDYLMQAMQDLGDGFGRGEVSLPHLLKSADVMRQAMGFLETYMQNTSGVALDDEIQYKGVVVLGTVYQDVHSIGKDLARTLLENYGYKVVDLGVMTPLQAYIDAAKEHKADAIGISALLVQTSNHMITVSKMMEEQGLDIPLLIGGAPVSVRHASHVAMREQANLDAIRPDVFYCRTAMDGVNVMNQWMAAAGRETLLEKNREKLQKRYLRSVQQTQDREEQRAELPRRVISFAQHTLPDTPRFAERVYRFDLREFASHLDRETLYSLNWRFGSKKMRAQAGHTEAELDALFETWVARASEQHWLEPQGVIGIYPCQSDGDEVIVYNPDEPAQILCRLDFSVVIGAEKKDTVSAAQYFLPKSEGRMDAIGLQISCGGAQIETALAELKAAGDSESHLLLQGLSDRVAEDMASFLHQEQRHLLGLAADAGQRWSPGYPGMRNIALNHVLWQCLQAEKHIGVEITTAHEFSPTSTTAAAVCYHPDAQYT